MNAHGLITAAKNWVTVPERKSCKVHVPSRYMNNTVLASGYPIKVIIPTTGCWNSNHAVRYIEHVEVITSINYTIRGALQILLESPSGTTARLLSPRHLDESDRGFENWTFMSVMTWGEIAEGVWSLIISDTTNLVDNYGMVGDTTLILHGTSDLPDHMRDGPRNYNENYNRIQNRMKAPYDEDLYQLGETEVDDLQNNLLRRMAAEKLKERYYDVYENGLFQLS
nr:unnamed protein product [Callosobruchus chinensis]